MTDPYESKYKKNGWTTKKERYEHDQKQALEEREKRRTHCSHCDSTNFIEVKCIRSSIHERICFECNVCVFKNPKESGEKFLDYPRKYYNKLIEEFNIKELEE